MEGVGDLRGGGNVGVLDAVDGDLKGGTPKCTPRAFYLSILLR
jgi:hypothetical protein